jgi:predicted HAD superfamily Cof-like phosphohydrolase
MLLVEHFNKIILKLKRPPIGFMEEDDFKLSLNQLREEIDEMELANNKGDFSGLIDAIVDLDYFLHGVVFKHGINTETYEELFKVVHEANMEKMLGVKPSREGFGGSPDAIKSSDWKAPETKIGKVLEAAWRIQTGRFK